MSKILILYPPKAYPYMPYMAPYVLKGYIESNSTHQVRCLDLNGEYFAALWSGQLFNSLDQSHSETSHLLAEYVVHNGPAALTALKDAQTYTVATYEQLRLLQHPLTVASKLVAKFDRIAGGHRSSLPGPGENWGDILVGAGRTLASSFLREKLSSIATKNLLEGISIVGLSATYLEQLPYCLEIAQRLKEGNPSIKVVIGGGAFTHIHEMVLNDPTFFQHIDFGIPYEGEFSFLELINALELGNDTSRLRNIIVPLRDTARFDKDLSVRPSVAAIPNFADLNPELYPTPEPIYPVLTSKGCYWGKCAFCTHHEGYGEGFQKFTVEFVEAAIRATVSQGARALFLVDEALPPSTIAKLARIVRSVKAEFGIDVTWMAECRAEKSADTDEFIALLAQSGCRLLVNGIESGSDRVLASMRKGIDLGVASRLAKRGKPYGIRTGWMFFVGFPGETEAEAQETFDYIRQNQDWVDFASVGTFLLEKGSPLWNSAEKWSVAPIVRPDHRYQIVFPYINQKTKLMANRVAAKERLATLLEQNRDLEPVFNRSIDRSFAFFVTNSVGRKSEAVNSITQWESSFAGLTVRYDVAANRIEALARPSLK